MKPYVLCFLLMSKINSNHPFKVDVPKLMENHFNSLKYQLKNVFKINLQHELILACAIK